MMEWSDALWILVFVLVTALFLGPGMWSSSTNTLAKDLWLKWKERKNRSQGERTDGQAKKKTKPEDGQEPQASERR